MTDYIWRGDVLSVGIWFSPKNRKQIRIKQNTVFKNLNFPQKINKMTEYNWRDHVLTLDLFISPKNRKQIRIE